MTKTITTIADLTPDPSNARSHNPRNIGMIERSLNEVGAARSIVIDETGVVLAGNGLIEAAVQAGIERVRVIEADGNEIIAVRRSGLTSAQKTALALYDNRTNELSDWNPTVLSDLAESGVDLSSLFYPDELAEILAGGVELIEEEPDEPVSVDEGKPTRCQLGDVWRVGRHTVACLDSTEPRTLDRLLEESPDMVWSDPPYGIDVHISDGRQHGRSIAHRNTFARIEGDKTTDTARAAVRVCLTQFEKAVQVWWGANYYADELPPSQCWVVWDKETGTNDFADAELAWVSNDSAVRIFRHMWSGLMKDSERGNSRVHPTQKPIALCAWAFEKYGSPNDIIFDPFLGSGPSLKAAEVSNRTVVGCELSPAYIDHILEWGEAHGLPVERVE